MKISLNRTGGFIPLSKKAETEVNWTEDDINQLKKSVEPNDAEPGNVRDGITYTLDCEGKKFIVDWQKIPSKYKSVMEKLKTKLTTEKKEN